MLYQSTNVMGMNNVKPPLWGFLRPPALRAVSLCELGKLAIDFFAVSDADDENEKLLISDGVYYPVPAGTYAIQGGGPLAGFEGFAFWRVGVCRKRANQLHNCAAFRQVQFLEVLFASILDDNFVCCLHRCPPS